jgi:hypothetical protein
MFKKEKKIESSFLYIKIGGKRLIGYILVLLALDKLPALT